MLITCVSSSNGCLCLYCSSAFQCIQPFLMWNSSRKHSVCTSSNRSEVEHVIIAMQILNSPFYYVSPLFLPSPSRTWTGRRCCRGRCPLPSSPPLVARKTSATLTRSSPLKLRPSRRHVSLACSPAKTRKASGNSTTSLTSASELGASQTSRNVRFWRLRNGCARVDGQSLLTVCWLFVYR